MNITGFEGWLLDRACQIDEACPGFVGALLRASNERRHVAAAYLAVPDPVTRFADDSVLGAFLMRAGHDKILAAAFVDVPGGLRSCLRRSGDRPHSKRHYRYLVALLSSERTATVRLLQLLDRIDPARLQIARALPDELQVASLAATLKYPNDARDLARLYMMLVDAGVSKAPLLQAVQAIRNMADVRRLVSKWSLKLTFPAHPVPIVRGYESITTGAQLREAAIRLRNCARTYIPHIMEGRSAFAVVTAGDHEAMVHLTRHGDDWALDNIYGPGNAAPEEAVEQFALRYLANHGVARRRVNRSERGWAFLRRLGGYHDYELD